MKHKNILCTKKPALILVAFMFFAWTTRGAGYELNSEGVRQMAMGGTGSGWIWDASTIFYNPAGLARLENMQAYGSLVLPVSVTSYVQTPVAGYQEESKTSTLVPFNVYVGGPIRDGSPLAIGLGIYSPYGHEINWANDWRGRFVIQHFKRQSYFFQPTISYQVSDRVSIGGGVIFALGHMELQKALPYQDLSGRTATSAAKGNTHGFGYSLGIHIQPNHRLQIGLNYRSQTNMEMNNGSLSFGVPSSIQKNFPNTSFNALMPLPGSLTAGAGFQLSRDLIFTLEAQYTHWDVIDTLGFHFEEETPLPRIAIPREFKNTLAFRLGAHYQASERLEVMIGGAYEPTPVERTFVSPAFPDADQWILSGGLVFEVAPKVKLLGALQYATTQARTAESSFSNFSGKYKTNTVIPSLGLSYDLK